MITEIFFGHPILWLEVVGLVTLYGFITYLMWGDDDE